MTPSRDAGCAILSSIGLPPLVEKPATTPFSGRQTVDSDTSDKLFFFDDENNRLLKTEPLRDLFLVHPPLMKGPGSVLLPGVHFSQSSPCFL